MCLFTSFVLDISWEERSILLLFGKFSSGCYTTHQGKGCKVMLVAFEPEAGGWQSDGLTPTRGSPAPHGQCHHKYSRESCSINDPPISPSCTPHRQTEMLLPLSWGVARWAVRLHHSPSPIAQGGRKKCEVLWWVCFCPAKSSLYLCCSTGCAHSCRVKLLKTNKSRQGREPEMSFTHRQTYSSLVLALLRHLNHYTEINF